MLATTILVEEQPVCVVRPTDRKDLDRFIRNAKSYLLAGREAGAITYRAASDEEAAKWQKAFALHRIWSGSEEGFFGVPL